MLNEGGSKTKNEQFLFGTDAVRTYRLYDRHGLEMAKSELPFGFLNLTGNIMDMGRLTLVKCSNKAGREWYEWKDYLGRTCQSFKNSQIYLVDNFLIGTRLAHTSKRYDLKYREDQGVIPGNVAFIKKIVEHRGNIDLSYLTEDKSSKKFQKIYERFKDSIGRNILADEPLVLYRDIKLSIDWEDYRDDGVVSYIEIGYARENVQVRIYYKTFLSLVGQIYGEAVITTVPMTDKVIVLDDGTRIPIDINIPLDTLKEHYEPNSRYNKGLERPDLNIRPRVFNKGNPEVAEYAVILGNKKKGLEVRALYILLKDTDGNPVFNKQDRTHKFLAIYFSGDLGGKNTDVDIGIREVFINDFKVNGAPGTQYPDERAALEETINFLNGTGAARGEYLGLAPIEIPEIICFEVPESEDVLFPPGKYYIRIPKLSQEIKKEEAFKNKKYGIREVAKTVSRIDDMTGAKEVPIRDRQGTPGPPVKPKAQATSSVKAKQVINAAGENEVKLSWKPGANAKWYKVYVNGNLYETTTDLFYNHTEVKPGKYQYTIVSLDENNIEGGSIEAEFEIVLFSAVSTSTSTSTTAPTALKPTAASTSTSTSTTTPIPAAVPEDLKTTVTTNTIELKWRQGDARTVSYNIYVNKSKKLINRTKPSYIHSGLTPGTNYFYEIRPVDKDGKEGFPVQTTVKTQSIITKKVFTPPTVSAGKELKNNYENWLSSKKSAVFTLEQMIVTFTKLYVDIIEERGEDAFPDKKESWDIICEKADELGMILYGEIYEATEGLIADMRDELADLQKEIKKGKDEPVALRKLANDLVREGANKPPLSMEAFLEQESEIFPEEGPQMIFLEYEEKPIVWDQAADAKEHGMAQLKHVLNKDLFTGMFDRSITEELDRLFTYMIEQVSPYENTEVRFELIKENQHPDKLAYTITTQEHGRTVITIHFRPLNKEIAAATDKDSLDKALANASDDEKIGFVLTMLNEYLQYVVYRETGNELKQALGAERGRFVDETISFLRVAGVFGVKNFIEFIKGAFSSESESLYVMEWRHIASLIKTGKLREAVREVYGFEDPGKLECINIK